ncbi:MAG: hypothetical protein ABI232_01100 [Jatrophihabitantaceae bacterium]
MRTAKLAATVTLRGSSLIRRAIPVGALPALARWRTAKLWTDPEYVRGEQNEMRFLLQHTERAPEIPQLARKYSEQMVLRAYVRWHPRAITHQRIQGIEWLTTRRDQSRAVVLSFLHHHRYEGMFGSLARAGAPCSVLTLPAGLHPSADAWLAQQVRLFAMGGPVIPASGGTEALAALVRPGLTLAIASDVPGHTPVTFLGRRVLASSGAARIATMTDTPVIVATHRRDEVGPYVQLDEPLEPRDFVDSAELLDELLRRHAEAVLAWPEALDVPTSRWGTIDG